MAADHFDTAVEQLYGGPPEHFVERRDAAVKHARSAGEKELADRIKALRRPTTAAALINRLRRSGDRSTLDQLFALGERLRDAQSALDVKAMKALSTERNSLISRLVGEIADQADEPVSSAVREQLSDTFTAAVADADAAHAVGSGRLVTRLRYSGFGEVDLSEAVATPLPAATSPRSSADDAATSGDAEKTDQEDEVENEAADCDTAAQRTADHAAGRARQAAERERKAAEQRLGDARAALSKAQHAEQAAAESVQLAERALAAARRTAKSARTRADRATAERAAAEDAVRSAEADLTDS